MTCTICGQPSDETHGHWCVVAGCDQWIGECCGEGIAMCERHFQQARKEAGV